MSVNPLPDPHRAPMASMLFDFRDCSIFEFLPENKALQYIFAAGALFFFYCVTLCIYRLYFHPLAKFPGPWLARVSQIWICRTFVSGYNAQRVQAVHEKYGPIVRLSPNDLSFATPTSWHDIYGKSKDRKQFIKTEMYQIISEGFGHQGLGTEPDFVVHSQQRKLLAPIFSKQAIRDFEKLLLIGVDKLVRALEREGTTAKGVDISVWMHNLLYDVMADLVFGETSGVMDKGGESYYVNLVNNNINFAAYIDAANRYIPVRFLLQYFVPKSMFADHDEYVEMTKAATKRRIDQNSVLKERPDMISYFLKDADHKGVSIDQIAAHLSQILLGGSGTSANIIIDTIDRIIHQPSILQKLRDEIIPLFNTSDEITALLLFDCKYLTACIKESLRLLFPAVGGMHRYSPGETVDGHYIPAGTTVSTNAYTLSRSSEYFKDPYAFNPDRWLDPDSTDVKSASQPFGLGPRQCIGQTLAWEQMRVIVAKLLFLFDLELVESQKIWGEGLLNYLVWEQKPLYVRVKRREDALNDPIWARIHS